MAAPEEMQTQAATPARPEPGRSLAISSSLAAGGGYVPDITQEQIDEGVPEKNRRDVRKAEQQLQRRLADAALFQTLTDQQFSGPGYDRFANELAAYGLAVMKGWLCTGHIFRVVRSKGILLAPTEYELDLFARSAEERESLALTTVTVALTQFKKRAMADIGWKADGGASITTYFMGACAMSFPNELARVRVLNRRWSRSIETEEKNESFRPRGEALGIDTGQTIGRNPANVVVGDDAVQRLLAGLKDREREVVLATLQDYTQDEIAELLGYKSRKAVEGVLYRTRRKHSRVEVDDG
ncbi:sigma-70 family RNA polymerase sigma factor [Rhodococcus spelaei]|uniref:Sigma-70 family RNA polymerase sigma factor n=1 Tax=Rhodococcus spelaei TaxID=2546320 RepID=A0A541AZ05_9NOCA|nr:sigma factor-like helix-turn-helix DNA-binding protein [Rhodococcus spelaei]TQF65297.1 sigma-70 family RNA polymerase sigma factor [Rhodococcus spelaei]